MAEVVVPRSLPVCALEPPRIDAQDARRFFMRIAHTDEVVVRGEDDIRIRLVSGEQVLDVDKRSGHFYLAHTSGLWNPLRTPDLPAEAEVRRAADEVVRAWEPLLGGAGVRPEAGGLPRPQLQFVRVASTEVASGDEAQGRPLDMQALYGWYLDLPSAHGEPVRLPVTGGGGRLRVAFGHRGALIGLSGGWRRIVSVKGERPVKPRRVAESELRRLFPGRRIANVQAQLAYYAAPAFRSQELLVPVWVLDGEVTREGERCAIRTQILPATDIDPFGPQAPDVAAPVQAPAASRFACGAAWFGKSGGSFEANKNGFLDACRGQGGAVKFDLGNDEAHERHFHVDDAVFADAVDIVFFTGHANAEGWEMRKPDQFRMSYAPLCGPPVRFGDQSLRWLVVAACGPLQPTEGGGSTANAIQRWGRTFAGLHGLLGFASVSHSDPDEGKCFMGHIGSGLSVVAAWLRTATEIQPPHINRARTLEPMVAAMYAHGGDHCTCGEQLYGSARCDFDPATQHLSIITQPL
jgi:hypothetical protein